MRMTVWTTMLAVSCAGIAFAADPTPAPMATPSAGMRPAPVNARRALGQTITQIDADNIALAKVVDYLRNVSGANILVNWKALEAAGIAQDTPISIQVRGLTLRKALQLVLDQASPTVPVTYNVDQNVISITTQEDADRVMITKVYIVDDLVMPDDDSNIQPPTFNLQQLTQGGSSTGGGGGGGGGQSLFSNTSTTGTNAQVQTADQKGQQLVELIRDVVRPSIWKENGGPAAMRYFNGKLIVTAPQSVQEMIGGNVESGTGSIRVGM